MLEKCLKIGVRSYLNVNLDYQKENTKKVYQTSETLCFWGFSLPLTLGEMSRYVVKLFWSKS